MKQDKFMPKPRLALHVGITGHRADKIGIEAQSAIERTLRTLFATIDTSVAKIAAETRDRFYASTAPLVGLVSALAEGADRYAIAAIPANWRLNAVLPMPRVEYVRDFQDSAASESVAEFEHLLMRADSVTELSLLQTADVRDAAGRALHYEALGNFLVSQIDLLVAVWDGAEAKGPGGTAAVVERALAQRRPVLWIDINNIATPHLLVALDPIHVHHRWEKLDAPAILSLLKDLLIPPTLSEPQHPEHGGSHKEKTHGKHSAAPPTAADLPSYFALPWPKPMRLPFAYNLLRFLSGAGRWSWPIAYPSFDELAKGWDKFFSTVPGAISGAAKFNERIASILLPRSIWADAIAWYYGNLYRSAYVSIFILAGLSVPIGLCYLFFLDFPTVLDIKAGFVMAELLIISTVVIVVRRGVRDRWHDVWLETRELSEQLRLGRSLAYVGASHDFVATPHAGEPETLSAWYIRATFREIGPPNSVLDDAYLRQVLAAALSTEIEEQRAYHAANARNLEKIHHMLHHKGNACFVATIALLVAYLIAWFFDHLFLSTAAHAQGASESAAGFPELFHEFLEYYLKPIVSIGAAGLPALGAALSGIGAQGDFEGFAQRSAATRHGLAEVERQIADLIHAPELIGLAVATDILLTAARIMAKDVSAWQQLYVSKRLTLPA